MTASEAARVWRRNVGVFDEDMHMCVMSSVSGVGGGCRDRYLGPPGRASSLRVGEDGNRGVCEGILLTPSYGSGAIRIRLLILRM